MGEKINLSMTREADFQSKSLFLQRFGWAILARNPVFCMSIYEFTFLCQVTMISRIETSALTVVHSIAHPAASRCNGRRAVLAP